MSFVMGGSEILRDYRTAANKKTQLRILAELNACTRAEIADFLIACGESVDKRWLNGGSRKAADTHTHTQPAAGDGAAESAEDPSQAAEPGDVSGGTAGRQVLVTPDTSSGEAVVASEASPPAKTSRPTAAGDASAAPEPNRGMTAGVLAALLAKIDPEAVVRMDGWGVVSWLHVSVCYGPDGERRESEVGIHTDE